MIYVDTNVILDLVGEDPRWLDWSMAALREARLAGEAVTGPIVVAELAGQGAALEAVLALIHDIGLRLVPFDAGAGHRAGEVFRQYRRNGGGREKILADFLIGGHSVTLGATLLTRDPRWYRRYFPELELITPEDDNG